jgi:tetratricopeptide (TPR) repeat protein
VRHQFLTTLLVGTVLAVCTACSSPKERGSEWVDMVHRAHQRADEGATSGTLAMEPMLRAAIAEAPRNPNERERWVIQDLHYRLAQLLLDAGELERAAIEVVRGLRADDAATLARANLLALQGKAFERQGERQKAAESFHAALLINELLMDEALAGITE